MSHSLAGRAVEIEPSLCGADFARLGAEVETLLDAGARVFHVDVGDGHFFPEVTVGPVVVRSVAPIIHATGGAIDCHLMVDNPVQHFPQFARAGADLVSFQVEAVKDVAATVTAAREFNLQVGVALNPRTPAEKIVPAAAAVDTVCCAGAWSADVVERVKELRAAVPPRVQVQVEDVDAEHARALVEAGATRLVCETAIFGRSDRAEAYRELVEAAC